MSLRMEKVNSQLKKKITEIVQHEIDDPHVGFVSITRVKTTTDLRESKVYFSVLNDNFSEVSDILNKMSSFIRVLLGKKIRLKILPQLTFIPDDSIRYSVEMYQKIEEVKSAEENNRNDTEQ